MDIHLKKLAFPLLSLVFVLARPDISEADLGPLPAPNPSVGMPGGAGMHGDTASSDATMSSGPGAGLWDAAYLPMFGACSTVLIRQDGHPFVLCTAWIDRSPVVRILDKNSGHAMDKLRLPAGSLLGGVYAYIDSQDRLVMVDGDQNLVRVKASRVKKWLGTVWKLSIDESVSLAETVTSHCGGGSCDAVVSISPDAAGSVWFATRGGLVGIYHPQTDAIEAVLLAENETIHNSFSTTNDGRAAIATDHALYLLHKDEFGVPTIIWRREYDRGSSRHPGQLSHGTGATPTFFGPGDGTEYVTITDNGDSELNLLVWDGGRDTPENGGSSGALVCSIGLFGPGAAGTENSAIGIGNSVFVASTYGYPYPEVPEGAGPAVPEEADFAGGMVRVDIREDRTGCDLVWENAIRSAAVPKLSVSDDIIYTVERRSTTSNESTNLLDVYDFVAVCPHTGTVLGKDKVGGTALHNTLQMAGNIGQGGVYWQGTMSGIFRISAK